MDTLLINIADVRKFTGLSKNVASSKYKQFIISAQNIQLKEIIGKECLEQLKDAKCAGTLDQYQIDLLEVVKPLNALRSQVNAPASFNIFRYFQIVERDIPVIDSKVVYAGKHFLVSLFT